MSARRGDSRDTAAAAGFTVFLALAGGIVGMLIAAAAVGIERAWSGRRGDRPARDASRRSRIANHRAWLDRDAAEREAWHQARRDWWRNGADPATRPPAPSRATRYGRAARRLWARTAVRAADFRAGWRDGWQAAADVRRDGGTFSDIVKARPDMPASGKPGDPKKNATDGDSSNPDADSAATDVVHDGPVQRRLGSRPDASGPDYTCPICGKTVNPLTMACIDGHSNLVLCENRRHVVTDFKGRAPCPICHYKPQPKPDQTQSSASTGGDEMTAPAMTQSANAAPRGDSNAAAMATQLEQINAVTGRVSELADALSAARAELAALTQRAAEFAEATEQSAQTRTALDAANAVVNNIGAQVGNLSESAEQASDEVGGAREGLRPVEEAEDALAQAGAGAKAVAQAVEG